VAISNYVQPYRPLRPGAAILNPLAGQPGTIACTATSDGVDRWIVSCFHVLCRLSGPGVSQPRSLEVIFQPTTTGGVVARTEMTRADRALDCAAAKVDGTIQTVSEIIGIGAPRLGVPAVVGTRVLKSGQETGVTEGVITAVNGAEVRIEPSSDFPPGYVLSGPGDSGALWVTKDTKAAIALHRAGSAVGGREVFGVSIGAVLTSLRLFLA
jgi:hypothetical protein